MRAIPLLLTIAIATTGWAQSTAEYLQLRKKHGITTAVGVGALETLVGDRTLEVSGVVKGCVSSSDGGYVYLQGLDGADLTVRCNQVIPEWLRGGDVSARLLIKASRTSDTSPLEATLLGAAVDSTIARHDTKPTAKSPAKPGLSGPIGKRTSGTKSSRGSSTIRSGRKWNMAAMEALPYYTRFIQNHNKRLSQAEAQRIAEGIIGFSLEFGVDARLIVAMVICESDFRPNLVSRAGAQGLGQLMPGTAKGLGVRDSFDVTQNLYGTVKLISGHIGNYKAKTGDDFEGLVLSLAAYNAGGGAVRKYGGVPPYRETQNYVRKVIAKYNQLCGSD